MKDWIKQNEVGIDESVEYAHVDSTCFISAYRGGIYWDMEFTGCDGIVEERRKFGIELGGLGNYITATDRIVDSLFVLDIVRKCPEAKRSMMSSNLDIVVTDPLRILNIAIKPFLESPIFDDCEDRQISIESTSTKIRYYTQSSKHIANALSKYCSFSFVFNHNGRTLTAPDKSFTVSNNLGMSENLKEYLGHVVLKNQELIGALSNPKYLQFISEYMEVQCHKFPKMTSSSFSKMETFMNSHDVGSLVAIQEHSRNTEEYIIDDDEKELKHLLSMVGPAVLKKPVNGKKASFSVTLDGIQFKMENATDTYLGPRKQAKSYTGPHIRFDVNISFTSVDIFNIVKIEEPQSYSELLPFYNILKEIGGYDIFISKLEMNALSNM